jgi:hypothetical protein
MKTICSLTRLETWRLRNGYAPARGGAWLVSATELTLGHQILGYSEVSKQLSCAVCRDPLQVRKTDLHAIQQRPEP